MNPDADYDEFRVLRDWIVANPKSWPNKDGHERSFMPAWEDFGKPSIPRIMTPKEIAAEDKRDKAEAAQKLEAKRLAAEKKAAKAAIKAEEAARTAERQKTYEAEALF